MLRSSTRCRASPREALPGFLPSQDMALPSAIVLSGEPKSLKSLNHPASWEQGFAPNLFCIHAHHFLSACRDMGLFLAFLVLRLLPVSMDTGLSVLFSGPQPCPTSSSVSLGPKHSSKPLS